MKYSLTGCRWWLRRAVSVSAFATALTPWSLMAAEPVKSAVEAVSVSQIINLLAGLALVLLVFFAVVFLLKRVSGFHGMNKGHMKMVDTMHLGTKERLLIVRVNNEYLLLGLSPQGIHPLHVLGDDIVESEGHEQKEAPPAFNQLLSRMKIKGA